MEAIDLRQKFTKINETWQPKIIASLNENYVKLAKLKGDFIWHQHEREDELFLVVRGNLVIELRDKVVRLNEGDLVVIPRGMEHRPIAEEEVWVMLVEPQTTVNTGNITNERTVSAEWI